MPIERFDGPRCLLYNLGPSNFVLHKVGCVIGGGERRRAHSGRAVSVQRVVLDEEPVVPLPGASQQPHVQGVLRDAGRRAAGRDRRRGVGRALLQRELHRLAGGSPRAR